MKNVPFTKFSGAGNDFILLEAARLPARTSRPALARRLCARRTSLGADGLLIIGRGPRLDYYNADGSKAFCGNGTRCAAVWVRRKGWGGPAIEFSTDEGIVACRVLGPQRAAVRLPQPSDLRPRVKVGVYTVGTVNTGVPHAVLRVSAAELDRYPVVRVGRGLRRHRAFRPGGANIDFIQIGKKTTRIRTYERGVEDETLACGTGAAAAALMTAAWTGKASPVKVLTQSGDILTVRFHTDADGRFRDVWLEGPARAIYEGEIRL